MDSISFDDYFILPNMVDGNIWSSLNADIQDFNNTRVLERAHDITCDSELTIPLLDPSHAYPTPDLTPAAEYPQTSHDIEKDFYVDEPQLPHHTPPTFVLDPHDASYFCQWDLNHELSHESTQDLPPPPTLSSSTRSTEDATFIETANAQTSEDDCFPRLHTSRSAVSETLFEDVIDFQALADLLQSGPQDSPPQFIPNLSQTEFDAHTPMETQIPLSPSTCDLLASFNDYRSTLDTLFRCTETSNAPHAPSGVEEQFSGAAQMHQPRGFFAPDIVSSGSFSESSEDRYAPDPSTSFTYSYSVATPHIHKSSRSASAPSLDYNTITASTSALVPENIFSSPDRTQASTFKVAGLALSPSPVSILQRTRMRPSVPQHTSELELLRQLYSSTEFQKRLPDVPVLEDGLADPEAIQEIEGRKSHKGHAWRFTLLSHHNSKLENPRQWVFFVCVNPRKRDCFYVCSESSSMNHHQYRNDHTATRNMCLCGKAFGRLDSLRRHLKRKNSEFHQLVED